MLYHIPDTNIYLSSKNCTESVSQYYSQIRKHDSCNETNENELISQIYFGIELYMFRTGFLSIFGDLVMYTQQYVYVIQVMLTVC